MAADVIGIRPGEKLHEVMCPSDDSHLTLEFPKHYVIRPTIRFYNVAMDYTHDGLGDEGKPVTQGFEYNSGANEHFLSPADIREFNRIALEP
jgi:UDP-N-acetylglucosamine 4,6-dehydratase